ncbi:hypothetical protein [Paracoccus sp. (in: a-proteobacteria)]|uniref:hypothetical protein n=1 Tax=Paracoccus sp. TaxID=267 RepID=UPI0028A8FFC0|nr:hypothetical protein [Paracoccus sp. (in: a-proteobacteria)]
MSDRLKRMWRMLQKGLWTGLSIAITIALIKVAEAVFGFWPATIFAVAIIVVCLWIDAGEEADG